MRISDITPDVLFRAYVARGWKPFTEGDYNLNIIGIRADDRKSNTFNDLICLLYKTDGRWVLRKYAATTDPGLYYRQNPLNPRGTAILKDGYYRGAFGIGLHHGQYRCLVQTKPLPLWRDGNRDGVLDFGGKVSEEMADIHIHRASASGTSSLVDRWSAGCQVIASSADWADFMRVVGIAAKRWGGAFSYALFREQDLGRSLSDSQAGGVTALFVGVIACSQCFEYAILIPIPIFHNISNIVSCKSGFSVSQKRVLKMWYIQLTTMLFPAILYCCELLICLPLSAST